VDRETFLRLNFLINIVSGCYSRDLIPIPAARGVNANRTVGTKVWLW